MAMIRPDPSKEVVVARRRWPAVLAFVSVVAGPAAAARQVQPETQAARAETRERNLRTYTELLRSDIRQQKVAVITELMLFTEAEDAVFWPIYREYEFELSRLNDERLRLIEKYGEIHDKFTDQQADDVIMKGLDLESRRTALKQRYYAKLKSALPPRVAAKAVYIEHQLDLLVDLQIAAWLPVAPAK
jgi:hypothetical protein